MLNQKSVSSFIVACFFAAISTFAFTSCSGGSESKESADTTAVQAAPAETAPAMDSSAAKQADTTALDSASTRPVKSPN